MADPRKSRHDDDIREGTDEEQVQGIADEGDAFENDEEDDQEDINQESDEEDEDRTTL